MNCYILIMNTKGTVPDKDCTFYIRKNVLSQGFLKQFHCSIDSLILKKSLNGKPFVEAHPQFQFNLSNTYDHVHNASFTIAGAFSPIPVGIDIEYPRPLSNAMMKRCYSPSEQNYLSQVNWSNDEALRLWTLKESYVKYTGFGLNTNLSSISFWYDSVKEQYVLEQDPSLVFHTYTLENNLLVSLCTNQNIPITLELKTI